MISHSKPTLDDSDREALLGVLASGRLVQGEQVARFEGEVSACAGVTGAAAVSSGTAALHLGLLALGVGAGDEVVIPSYVCSALLQAVSHVGAKPVLADVDPGTFNIDAEDVRRKVTAETKAVIVPHMFGLPADMDEILSLGIPVIEDCAQAVGASFGGARVGSLGVMSIFSFYATKMLATGEGGMVCSGDEGLVEKIRDMRDYDERKRFSPRFNYKMTDMEAALGISQLKRLPSFIRRRREIAALYDRCLGEAGIGVPRTPPGREHVYYRYVFLLDDDASGFLEEMNGRGVDCRRPVFMPLHRYFDLPDFPVSDDLWKRAVSVPIYPSMTDGEVRVVAESLRAALEGQGGSHD